MNCRVLLLFACAAAVSSAFAGDAVKQVKADFADYGSRAFVHYAVPAMSEVQRLPDVYPADGKPDAPVKIFAAKGEYEPGSFEVWGVRDLGKVSFELGEFKNETGAVFPKENLDLKLVKCWYQNLNGWFAYFGDQGDYKLVPELLLNDEDLIRTEAKTKSNYARLTDAKGKVREQWINPPAKMDVISNPFNGKTASIFQPMAPGFDDAAELKPVKIVKEEFRNFFLTVKTTKDTPAGIYRGSIVLSQISNLKSQISSLGSIPVEIHVADYELPIPKCYKEPERDFLCWFYHYNALAHIMGFNGGDKALALKQLDVMIRDMAEHGQSIHPCWFAMSFEELYTVDLCIKAGMRPDTFVGGALPYGATREARMDVNVRVANEYDRRFGSHNIYNCWGDEPGLSAKFFDELTNFIEEWHSLGMKHFIAGEECCFRKLGFGIDWFNMSQDPAKESRQLRLWNSVPGKRAAWYSNQHVGPENPAFNRRQNGLAPWLGGYTGFANYAHHLGPYNDESGFYKPMVFAYGAHSGMIDTIQWEGFREGIDDIRYATLLCQLARKAMDSKDAKLGFLGGKAFQYLALIERETSDLNTCRAEIRRFIDELLVQVKPDPVVALKRLPPKPQAADAALKAALDPLKAELASAKPSERGAVLGKIKKAYERFFRIEDLTDFLEQEGDLAGAEKYATDSFQLERADKLRMKLMRDPKVHKRDRARYAWSLILGHPELWDDKEAVELLSFVNEYKTNNYVSAWSTYGLLNDASAHPARYDESWKKAYRLVAKVADSAGIKGMGGRAASHGIRLFLKVGDRKTAGEIIARYLSNPSLKPADRYTFGLYAKLFGEEVRKPALFGTRETAVGAVVEAYEKEALTKEITTDQRVAAIVSAGKIANALCDTEMVRGLEAYRASLYKPEERRQYKVKFSEKPVLGTDWTGIDAETVLCDRKYGGSTELMYTDVTTGNRAIGDEKGKGKREPMRLAIAADAWGIHFRFESTDEKAMEMLAHRASGGSFEAYVAPGKNKPYVCCMKDDGEGSWRFWNTVYDAIGQRSIPENDANRARGQTVVSGDKIVTTLSLSWDNYADDVPRDGSVWDFEVFRWGRDSCAWNGCKSIHARSTWGELVFDLSDGERAQILRRVADNAFWAFRCEAKGKGGIDRYEGCVRHWNDKHVGDVAFYDERVKPWAENLLEAGKVLGEDPSDKTIFRLEENGTISQWHNVFFVLDRMRHDWLTK